MSFFTFYSLTSAGYGLRGICKNVDGNLWAADAGNTKFQRCTTSGTITGYSGPLGINAPISKISTGPDNDVWVGDTNGGVSKFNTTSLTGTRYGLGTTSFLSIRPGPDGNMWAVAQTGAGVGLWKVTTGGTGTRYNVVGTYPADVVGGPDGNLWIPGYAGDVFKISTAGVNLAIYTSAKGVAICVGPDNNLWVADGAYVHKVTTSGTVATYTLPGCNATGICAGTSSDLWISDQNSAVWRVTTAGAVTQHPMGFTCYNYDLCIGPDGNIWGVGNSFPSTSGTPAAAYIWTVPPSALINGGIQIVTLT